ncbi:MAG TPA: glycoside hydrolase family 3 C-terminal domain-containing protein [Haloplasmataceae bacterium]
MNIKELIKNMTLEEKASLCSGKNMWETQNIERLNIPAIMMSDGPHGLRKQVDKSDNLGLNISIFATCFPTAATSACSFNRSLLKKMGQAIALECRENDVDILLGPGVNIKRSPLCGRNFEYFSEDPYLSGELGASFTSGVQSLGVGVSVKHFACNNQEKYRHIVSSEIDERAKREIYLASFERVIQENPYTVMCSYNRINGVYTSEDESLLNKILRDEWKYTGVLITDWGACNDRVKGLKSGQDLEMPSSNGINDRKIIEAVKNGDLDEEILDRAVERILNLVFKCQNKPPYYKDIDNHLLAKEIACESMVLLKNDNHILPIKDKTIGIIGALANKMRIQGSGSSKINPKKVENILEVLTQENIVYKYAEGYSLKSDKTNKRLLKEAIELAKKVEIPIIFIGLTENYESEGFDREHLNLPHSHNHLVEEIVKVNSNVVVVLIGGAPVLMPWVNKVKGILNAYLGGESAALAIVDILLGKVNPSGKLAETYPLQLEPTFGGDNAEYYMESIYVGYRYYDKCKKQVLFPFGYGLSYTTFSYSDITVNKTELSEDEILEVSFKIKNTGNYYGKEICQLYIRDIESSVYKPEKELKEFTKVALDINEEKHITFKLDKRAFSYYNIHENSWIVESGEYEILIGSSSQDIRLKTIIHIKANKDVLSPYDKLQIPSYYDLSNGFNITDYKKLLARELPPQNRSIKRPFDYNSTLKELSHSFVGKFLLLAIKIHIRKTTKDKSNRLMMLRSMLDIPYRALISFGGEVFSPKLAQGLLLLMNRRYIKGLKVIFSKRGRDII